jgi:hypothetical protein
MGIPRERHPEIHKGGIMEHIHNPDVSSFMRRHEGNGGNLIRSTDYTKRRVGPLISSEQAKLAESLGLGKLLDADGMDGKLLSLAIKKALAKERENKNKKEVAVRIAQKIIVVGRPVFIKGLEYQVVDINKTTGTVIIKRNAEDQTEKGQKLGVFSDYFNDIPKGFINYPNAEDLPEHYLDKEQE